MKYSFRLVLPAILAAVQFCYAAGPAQATTPPVRDYFQALASNPAPAINVEEISAVVGKISGLPSSDMALALPAIFSALDHPSSDVKKSAIIALAAVSKRPDGTDLLKGEYLQRIMALLDSPDPQLQASPAYILADSRSIASPAALPRVLSFVKRKDRDTLARVETIYVLTKYAPGDADVIQALGEVLTRRPLDADIRMRALHAIRNSRTSSIEITNGVVQSLDASEEGVRLAAIGAVQQLGISALKQAEPKLRRLENKPDENPEVRAAARRAVNMIDPSD